MSSKELLIEELEGLGPLEILQLRNYLRELKGYPRKDRVKAREIDMDAIRQSFSKIKGSLSESISNEREDRI